MISVLLQLFGQTKVNDPQVVIVLNIGEHDVERLQVEVENSPAVYEVNTSNNLKIKIRVGIKSGTSGALTGIPNQVVERKVKIIRRFS